MNHIFELQSGVKGIARREISIHSRNIIKYLEFLIDHPDYCHNQTYEPYRIFNENEHRVYNKMHTGE